MDQGRLMERLSGVPALLIAAAVVVGFALALLGVMALHLPIWSLLLMLAAIGYGIGNVLRL